MMFSWGEAGLFRVRQFLHGAGHPAPQAQAQQLCLGSRCTWSIFLLPATVLGLRHACHHHLSVGCGHVGSLMAMSGLSRHYTLLQSQQRLTNKCHGFNIRRSFALICFASPCFALIYLALPCFALPRFASLCFVSLCFALLRLASSCFALRRLALPRFAVLCFVSSLRCLIFFSPSARPGI